MKTFFFISESGASLSTAYKLFDEENRVIFYCRSNPRIGNGLLESSQGISLSEILSFKPDVVVFDSPFIGSSSLASSLKEKGVLVFGTSKIEEAINSSPEYSLKFLKAHGLNVPRNFIFEPGTTQFVDCKVVLIFSSRKPLQVLYSFDASKFMNEDIGLPVCMGTICKLGSLTDRFIQEGISPLLSVLDKLNFSGQVSIRFIVTRYRLYTYGIDVGFFCPQILCVLDSKKFRLENTLMSLALNNLSKLPLRTDWMVAIRVAVAPFPYGSNNGKSDSFKIKGLNEGNLKHLWFEDISSKGGYYCERNTGSLCFVTARGTVVREARRRAYRTISGLEIPNPMYRTDVGNRACWEYPLLSEWRWLKPIY